jgi:hypothetical protein
VYGSTTSPFQVFANFEAPLEYAVELPSLAMAHVRVQSSKVKHRARARTDSHTRLALETRSHSGAKHDKETKGETKQEAKKRLTNSQKLHNPFFHVIKSIMIFVQDALRVRKREVFGRVPAPGDLRA